MIVAIIDSPAVLAVAARYLSNLHIAAGYEWRFLAATAWIVSLFAPVVVCVLAIDHVANSRGRVAGLAYPIIALAMWVLSGLIWFVWMMMSMD
jgi:hypothetical protein